MNEYLTASHLPENYLAFLRGMIINEQLESEIVHTYINFLQRKDFLEKIIQEHLQQLNKFSTKPEQAKHKEVQQGWQILRTFFSQKYILQHRRSIPIVYGSLLYDDPRNLDFDVIIVGINRDNIIAELSNRWHYELIQLWLNDREGDLPYLTFDNIERYVQLLQYSEDPKQLFHHARDIDLTFGRLSRVLNGSPLYSRDESQLLNYRRKAWLLIQQEPLLAALVAYELSETLALRNERRNLK